MKKIITILTSLLLLFSFTVSADKLSDFNYSTLPDADYYFYAYDETNTLRESSKKFIIDHSNELYEKTGVQIVVAVVNDLNDMTIENYSTRLFEKWEIGDKNDQGLLIVVKPKTATEKGQVRIEVGYGLMKIIPAQRADQIIRNVMIPRFKEENMEAGIMDGYEITLGLVADYLGVEIEGIDAFDNFGDEREGRISPLMGLIIFIIFMMLIRGGGRGGLNTLFWLSNMSGSGRSGGFGGGFSGGGGFGGGGGRSGGGGSSGSW